MKILSGHQIFPLIPLILEIPITDDTNHIEEKLCQLPIPTKQRKRKSNQDIFLIGAHDFWFFSFGAVPRAIK